MEAVVKVRVPDAQGGARVRLPDGAQSVKVRIPTDAPTGFEIDFS